MRSSEVIDRPSASPGEREAAVWIRDRFRALGLDARIEEERAHGTYWWPLGIGTLHRSIDSAVWVLAFARTTVGHYLAKCRTKIRTT